MEGNKQKENEMKKGKYSNKRTPKQWRKYVLEQEYRALFNGTASSLVLRKPAQ